MIVVIEQPQPADFAVLLVGLAVSAALVWAFFYLVGVSDRRG